MNLETFLTHLVQIAGLAGFLYLAALALTLP